MKKSDTEALDTIALFMARPGQWNGGDVCEIVAEEIVATGRPAPGDPDLDDEDEGDGQEPDEATPAYVEALTAFHAGAVILTADDGTVLGRVSVMDESQDEEDERDAALRQAAVAWNYLRGGINFKVGDHTFTTTDCAEWWA